MNTAGSWQVIRQRGDAATFHGRDLPDPPGRELWLFEVSRPALVLGSARRDLAYLDTELAAANGIEIVRRRSGGAAVLLEPGQVVWADVIVPRHDSLWHDDIGRATWWVGHWWQRALAALGVASAVHQGAMVPGPWSDRLCFAGLGPGEVLIGGRKAVGVAQRRTRHGARFQTCALRQWDPTLLAALCGVTPLGQPLDDALIGAAVGLAGVTAGAVETALIASLP